MSVSQVNPWQNMIPSNWYGAANTNILAQSFAQMNAISSMPPVVAQPSFTGMPMSGTPTGTGISDGFQNIGLMGAMSQLGMTGQMMFNQAFPSLGQALPSSSPRTSTISGSGGNGLFGTIAWANDLLSKYNARKTSTGTSEKGTSNEKVSTTTSSASVSKLSSDKAERLKQIVAAAKRTYPDNPNMAKLVASQAVLESGLLGSPSRLATEGNNLFGIKGDGDAGRINLTTWEEDSKGNKYTIKADFAKYSSLESSFKYHRNLMKKDRYKNVWTAGSFEATAAAVRKAGYATDSKYAPKLIDIYNNHLAKYF